MDAPFHSCNGSSITKRITLKVERGHRISSSEFSDGVTVRRGQEKVRRRQTFQPKIFYLCSTSDQTYPRHGQKFTAGKFSYPRHGQRKLNHGQKLLSASSLPTLNSLPTQQFSTHVAILQVPVLNSNFSTHAQLSTLNSLSTLDSPQCYHRFPTHAQLLTLIILMFNPHSD